MEEMQIVFKIFQASNAIKGLNDVDTNILKKVESYLGKISEVVKADPSESNRIIHELNDTGFLDAVIAYCHAVKWLNSSSKLLASYDEAFTTINNPDILLKLKEELNGDDNM